ncbi:MAG: hypothetical protein RLZZ142_396, partial [Verrucomicrobiota bacterium]
MSLSPSQAAALPPVSRRAFLERCGMGFGSLGLAGLLS